MKYSFNFKTNFSIPTLTVLMAPVIVALSGCSYNYYELQSAPDSAFLDLGSSGPLDYLYLDASNCSDRRLVLTQTKQGWKSRIPLEPNKEIAVGIVGGLDFQGAQASSCKMMFSFTPLPKTEYAVNLQHGDDMCYLALQRLEGERAVIVSPKDKESFMSREPVFNWQERDPACKPRR